MMTPEEFTQQSQSWIETLRGAGAVFDNVRPMLGEHGACLALIDSAQPFRVHLPRTVLLDHQKIHPTATGFELDTTELSPEFARMWNEILSFTLSDERVESLLHLAATLQDLPFEVHKYLGALGLEGLSKVNDAVVARKKLIEARYLTLDGKYYLLPVLEFANHDRQGVGFRIDGNTKAVRVEGRSSHEVLINYTWGDAFHFLAAYHFPAEVNHAYSLPMRFEFGDRVVTVFRNYMASGRGAAGELLPKIAIGAKGEVLVSSVLLGEIDKSGAGYRSFEAVWCGAGLTHPRIVFDTIMQNNLNWLSQFYETLCEREGTWEKWLQAAVQQQRQIMALG